MLSLLLSLFLGLSSQLGAFSGAQPACDTGTTTGKCQLMTAADTGTTTGKNQLSTAAADTGTTTGK